MRARNSQADTLLIYLREHPEGIDRRQADDELGICSLARRVCDLKDRGIAIGVKSKKVPTRYQKSTTIAVYFLEKNQPGLYPGAKGEAPAPTSPDRSPDKDEGSGPAPSLNPKRFGPPEHDKHGQKRMF